MRLCSGCQTKVEDNVRYCDECQPQTPSTDEIHTHTTAYDELLDKLRKGTRWQRLRLYVVRQEPFCRRCGEAVTEIVDHIVPAAIAIMQAQLSKRWPFDRYVGYYLRTNLQGLCRSCHGTKTLEDKSHVGPWPDVVAKEIAAPKRRWAF